MQKLLLIIISVVPIIALSLAIYKAIVKKKQNKPIFINTFSIAFLSLFVVLPIISYFTDTDGLSFFMTIIIEYYVLSILIPWSIFVLAVLFITKKINLNTSKIKTTVWIIFLLFLFVTMCLGTFSGFFIDAMNWVIGGPTIQRTIF